MRTKLIEFTTTDQLKLPGLLYTPETNNNSNKKAVINLHGNGSASVFYSVQRAQDFARVFTKHGLSFFTFNNRGAHYIKTINVDQTEEAVDGRRDDQDEIALGTTYELIKDCVHDIEGAVNFLQTRGYEQFYLMGHSSGANKICVYNHYRPENEISRYILLGGGDDTGIWYQVIGDRDKYFKYLQQAKNKIEQGKGRKIIPKYILDYWFSYQSFYDVCNPDGD